MRKLLLAAALLMSNFAARAQVVATFDTFSLLTTYPDTAYINYTSFGNDVGFTNGDAYFPCIYDSMTWGYTWTGGFAYSNMTDSVTSGDQNQYSAKTAGGFNGSLGYNIYWHGYDPNLQSVTIIDTAAQGDTVLGFYITNTTFAFNAMRDGDNFTKKFGGIPNVDPDWFKVTVFGYLNGVQKADTVDFYLADFRFTDSTLDYIVDTWEWVDLTPLGNVDSVRFVLNSTDTAGGFGMNNPLYFAMDNFTTKTTTPGLKVGKNISASNAAKMYPNPANDVLFVEVNNSEVKELRVLDVTGKQVLTQSVLVNKESINISSLPAGNYYLQLAGDAATVGSRFVKQ